MEQNIASQTALLVAWLRAKHYAEEGQKIFEDPVAHRLITDAEHEHCEEIYIAAAKQFLPDVVASNADQATLVRDVMQKSAAVGEMLSRARYAEEKLAEAIEHGIEQYVIIGAGG